MPFRVLVFGPAWYHDYQTLRGILDAALANRLPDVELLSVGGPGFPAMVASYARSRGLAFTALPLDCHRNPADPRGPRNAELVGLADAAVAITDASDHEGRELLKLVNRRNLPVRIVELVRVYEPRSSHGRCGGW